MTAAEIKETLDEWVPKYIRQVVAMRTGGTLTAERFNELLNLLIEQGDDTIALITNVKAYMGALTTEYDATIEDALNTVSEAVTNMTAQVNDAKEQIDEIDERVDTYQDTVLDLVDERLDDLQEAITTTMNALTAAQEVVTNAQTIYNTIDRLHDCAFDGDAATLGGYTADQLKTPDGVAYIGTGTVAPTEEEVTVYEELEGNITELSENLDDLEEKLDVFTALGLSTDADGYIVQTIEEGE